MYMYVGVPEHALGWLPLRFGIGYRKINLLNFLVEHVLLLSVCSTNAQQWLDLIAVHHLKKLVYIDHGVGHQYLRVEFSSESACYTFLIRNDKKCTLCATMLARE